MSQKLFSGLTELFVVMEFGGRQEACEATLGGTRPIIVGGLR
jgi:hypothetical protein